jgi:pimeloyl-ACP methyl ester carboxylesterase
VPAAGLVRTIQPSVVPQEAVLLRADEYVRRVIAAEKRFVELHGHRLAYVASGDPIDERPVLLLIHGMAASAATWRLVIPALARHYTVVAPDLPGHGDSDKTWRDYSLGAMANVLRDLMVTLKVEHATVVGHSLGGGIAMQFAYQHPQYSERLVLVSSGGLGQEVSWILRSLALPGVEYLMPVLFPEIARKTGEGIFGFLRSIGLRAPGFEEEWAAYAALTGADAREPFLRTLRSVVDVGGQSVSAQDRLYLASKLPTLLMWGSKDRIIPSAHARTAQEAIPESRLVVFEETGHFLHVEEPHRFVEELDDFINSTSPIHLREADWKELLLSRAADS